MDKANKATKRAGAAAVNKQLDPDEETTSLLHDVEDPAAKTFKKTTPASSKHPLLVVPSGNWFILLLFTGLAFFTRFYKIGAASFVVWDEAHFGKFMSYYIKREYYHDVHPPLGKMLLGLAGVIAGYDGSFEFESEKTYPQDLNFPLIRMFAASFGALMVPLAYLTAVQLRLSNPAAILTALMVLTDISILNISRFILLDPILLFFTALSLYTLTVFRNYQKAEPFSDNWWLWLALNGFTLGCVVSVKWIGLFAIGLVGLNTIEDLLTMLFHVQWPTSTSKSSKHHHHHHRPPKTLLLSTSTATTANTPNSSNIPSVKMPLKTYIHHWLARIALLVILPIAVYMSTFAIHFAILHKSGTGDANMSSLFQAGLIGNTFDKNPLEIAYGSKVTFKNNGPAGGLLHSHVQTYPEGSKQQQITCYMHKDANNEWVVVRPWGYKRTSKDDTPLPEFVKDGDIVRLVHDQTGANLHSHDFYPAPLTKNAHEVTCYGNSTVGDQKDHWRIEIARETALDKPSTNKRIRSLTTRFRLRHVVSGCLLRSHSKTLPEWGFKQNEVACVPEADDGDIYNHWNVENHRHPDLQPAGPGSYQTTFLNDFWDMNNAMLATNNALTPEPGKIDPLVSKPYQWPFALVGLRMSGWGFNSIKYYLLGHPLIWWGSAVSVALFVIIVIVYLARGRKDWPDPVAWDNFLFAGKVSWIGWFFHYFPFWIMGRVCYLHHYFPAVYFATFLLAHTLDHLAHCAFPRSTTSRTLLLSVFGLAILSVFYFFSDFAFGFTGDASRFENRKWLSSWDIY